MQEHTNGYSNRNSSIELLKIISIFMIVLSHSVPLWSIEIQEGLIDLNLASLDIQNMILVFFKYLGQIGNAIFIICSSYFLLDNNKINAKKVLYIMADVFFISIAFLIVFLLLGYNLSSKELIKQIFPTTFKNNWFVTVYLIFYIIHPLLNIIIEKLNKKSLLQICMFIVIYYFCIQFIFEPTTNYQDIVGFVLIYFIVAYLKNFLRNYSLNKKLNIIVLLISCIAFISFIILENFIGCKIKMLSDNILRFATLMNPLVIIISISLFNLFVNKNYNNLKINYISSLSLLIYLIHENALVREYTKAFYWTNIENIFSYRYISLLVLFTAIGVFLASLAIAALYKETIQKLIKKICDSIWNLLIKIEEKCTNILLKLD